jgi:hypothetical protein
MRHQKLTIMYTDAYSSLTTLNYVKRDGGSRNSTADRRHTAKTLEIKRPVRLERIFRH